MRVPLPSELARLQIADDRARCADRPWLLAHKTARTGASPLAFLRGSAGLYAKHLAPAMLGDEPAGEGWIVGDLHLENFGAWRDEHDAVVFDLNDFDEATVGPWRYDLVRVVASIALLANERGLAGDGTVRLAFAFLHAWRAMCSGATRALPPCEAVERLVARVGRRTRKDLLDGRTELAKGRRRFVRGPRYRDLDASLDEAVRAAFTRYAVARGELDAGCVVDDVAFRIAGNGSVGALRVAVLVRASDEHDAHRIYDLKSQGAPLTGEASAGAARVVEAMKRCLPAMPRATGTLDLDGRSMLVRRLAPQEDKLDLAKVSDDDLDGLCAHLGALAGRAHRRAAAGRVTAWRDDDLDAVFDLALEVGAHLGAAWAAYRWHLARDASDATT